MTLFVTVAFFIFDLSIQQFQYIWLYVALIFSSTFAFVINKATYYETSKLILILAALGAVTFLAMSEAKTAGVYFMFFPIILGAFALYDFNKLYRPALLAVFSFICFCVAYFVEFDFAKPQTLNPEIVRINYALHFLVGVSSSIFIIVFLTKVNQKVEARLKRHEQELNEIAEALKESKQRFELAIRGSNAGIWDWNIQQNSIYHSSMWKEILRYNREELNNITVEEFYALIHPDDQNKVKVALARHLENKERYALEIRVRTKDGSYRWCLDSGQAVWDENGIATRMVGSTIDVTEMKEAEKRILKQKRMLIKTNKELDNFVYSTSHDLRAPLMSILGLVNVAKSAKSKDDISLSFDLITDRVRRLDGLLTDITDYSKNTRTAVKKEAVKPTEIIHEVIEELNYLENSNRINFKIGIPVKTVIFTDRHRFKVILKNLISNSIKYHNLNRRAAFIEIGMDSISDDLQFYVHDNGDGIDDSIKDRIFDMFFRGSENSTGSGLGLYIVNETVNKLNGKIKVQSTRSLGTRFSFIIPKSKYPEKQPLKKSRLYLFV